MAEPTIMAVAVAAVGPLKGARVVAFMVQWNVAQQALGDAWPADGIEAQVRAYVVWWRLNERTGWRELHRFRQVWPAEPTPTRLMDLAGESWDARRGVAGLGAVSLA